MTRLPKPMARQSQSAKTWNPYKLRERLEVLRREPRHTCEGCGLKTDDLQLAHIFGRRQIVGEPFASSRYLTAKLCYYNVFTDKIGCHEKIDRYLDADLRDRLEEQAARRLCTAFGIDYDLSLSPAGNVRTLADHTDPERVAHVLDTRLEFLTGR